MAVESGRDQIFANPQQQVVDFAFTAAVADVFPDMVRRSVPGYETVISQLGVLARRYAQADSLIYDLGCSLGAATLAMALQVRQPNVRYVCVDNSEAMVQRCQQRLQRQLSPGSFEVVCADICQQPMQQASVIVLNFTLQFIPPAERQALLQRCHEALLPGGVLILSEKIQYADPAEQALQTELYMEFKRANGYSELEISQKRTALENVLIPDTLATHQARLQQAGFSPIQVWFQNFVFVSVLAVKDTASALPVSPTGFDSAYSDLAATRLSPWLATLPAQVQAELDKPHGKLAAWLQTLANLPELQASQLDFRQGTVRIGTAADADEASRGRLREALETFIPWRKGPFELFGISIDTEWRSDWKWQRVAPHISPLAGRMVLDVGCGSGYHLWRMRGEGAALVVGIDPSLFFLMQFRLVKHYAGQQPVHFLPLRSEDLPDFKGNGFDTVLSMGVLYHRRAPLEHLQELKNALRAGGELVLETLVVEGDVHTALMPEERYGKMRNVWFIPSVLMLELWLRRLGFVDIRTVDVTPTTTGEQRSTDWMRFESLRDFLDPADPARTIEGYPAPVRAVIIATLPA